MKLIVGLGNPGKEYASTRHNIGFRCVDSIAKENAIQLLRKSKAWVGAGTVAGQRVLLAKPRTYMNLSGEAVQGLAYSHRVSSTDILVICDDMDLPLGNIRIRAKGSSGGHKGLQSIIERLGTQEFPRIRVGIGRDAERDAVDYVLSRFSQEEEQVVAKVVKQVGEAVQLVVQGELEAAMNRFNRRVAQ